MVAVIDWFRPKGRHHAIAKTTIKAQLPATKTQRAGFALRRPARRHQREPGRRRRRDADRPQDAHAGYEAYITCPWAWAAVQAIARTITAGGLVTDWTGDDGDDDIEFTG